jgi:glutaminyl-tRNA synthetase
MEIPTSFIEEDIKESVARGQAIITRYPPEPNGYAHIGHAKAFSISYALAKKYGGLTNLRYDDTNPAKENMEFVENLATDIKWLGLEYQATYFASDYYEQLYQFAIDLIKKGLAYVDDQTADQISETRGSLTSAGKESPNRNRSAEENLKLFADMRAGVFADGACVLRAKIDMTHPNMNMRDPVMYRVARVHHFRTHNQWLIYPLYDFAHPLSDMLENISHSICSLEYDDHRILYDWFVNNCKSKTQVPPRQFEFSRLNIERTVMSKRWLKQFVDTGVVDGWDDPRMPTISGMRRRGYTAPAIINFVLSTGISRTPMCAPLSALEFYVRSELDPIATRVAAVFNPIKVVITNYTNQKPEELQVANNPHDESAGKHTIHFGRELYIDGEDFCINPPPKYKRLTEGGTVRLRGAYILKCTKVHLKNTDNSEDIDYLECEYYPDSKSGSDTSGIKPNGVIHFVEATTARTAMVHEYFPLLKEGTELSEQNLASNTKQTQTALVEQYLSAAKVGDKFQFVRKGFYCVDKTSTAGNLVFNKTVGLKEGF